MTDWSRTYIIVQVAKIDALKWDVLRQPPYCPDIAASDYRLFWLMRMARMSIASISKKKPNIQKIRGSTRTTSNFLDAESVHCCQKDTKMLWLAMDNILNNNYVSIFPTLKVQILKKKKRVFSISYIILL